MKSKNKWSKENEDFLRDNWRSMSDSEIAQSIGKSVSSVYSKRHRNGMIKHKNDSDKDYHLGLKINWRTKRLLNTIAPRRKTEFIRDAIEYANSTGMIKEYQKCI